MRQAFRAFISVWLMCCFLISSAVAQQPSLHDWQRVAGLPPDSGILIWLKSGEKFQGALLSVTPTALVMNSDERGHPGRIIQQRTLVENDIREVRLFSRGTSILAGAGIGAAIGGGVGAGIDAAAKSNEDKGLATAVFALLGGLFGALIGRHAVIFKGETIYVAR